MDTNFRFKIIVILLEVLLFVLFVSGIVWAIFAQKSIGFVFAYVAGVATIVTPCTLPILLFSVSQVANKEYKKGLFSALSFGLGFVLVAGILGALFAFTGDFIGLPKISQFVFAIGGVVAYVYALSIIGNFSMPAVSLKMPQFKLKGTYAPQFVSGAMLSAGDIGCPNPLRFILLAFIISSGSIITGAWFGLVYGLGAITPILFFSLLSLIGINITKAYTRQVETMEKMLVWVLVPLAGFLITFALFGEAWFEVEANVLHSTWESILLKVNLVEVHGEMGSKFISNAGNAVFTFLLGFPLVFLLAKKYMRTRD